METESEAKERRKSQYTVDLLEKKKKIIEFCQQLLEEEKITSEQLATTYADSKSSYDFVSFLISLDHSQFNYMRKLLLSYQKQLPLRAMPIDNRDADARENPALNLLRKICKTVNDQQLDKYPQSAQQEEKQIHNEILRYQKKEGCRYDEAAIAVLGRY